MTKPVPAAIRFSLTTTFHCALAKIVHPLAATLLATLASGLSAQQVVTSMVTPASGTGRTAKVETANRAQAKAEMLTRPLVFEPNHGQAGDGMDFVSHGRGYTMLLSGSESTFVTAGGSTDTRERSIHMQLAGADSKAEPRAEKPLPGQSNYLLGNDPSRWVHGVQQFEQVRVADAYPGIDVLYYGNQRRVEHDFIVSPGKDAGQIRMQFSDAASQRIGERGDLELKTHEGSTVSLDRPVAYQTLANGSRRIVTADYAPLSGNTFGFRLGSYDRSLPLVIDPVVITYSTYLGGSEEDSVVDLRLDAAGNMYVLMDTDSSDLPVVSQISGACSGTCGPSNPTTPITALRTPVRDFYLAKLDPTGQTLLFATYIGGTGDDVPGALSIASDGGIYIAGETVSSDFPLVHEYSSTLAPSIDSYFPSFSTTLTRLSPDGSSILYSSLIGGGLINFGGIDGGRYSGTSTGSLAVAPDGIVYLLGFAETADGQLGNFVDAKNASFLAADGDYLAKFDTTKTGADSLIYATTFGQPGDQEGELLQAVALDSHQNVWLFGSNGYASPPTPTANAVQPVCDGGGQCHNVFLFALNPTGSLIYSTFLGGTTSLGGGPAVELPQSIFIDPSDNIYLTGGTNSLDFPLKNAASASGGSFLTKLSPGGLSILYSTYAPLDGYVTATSDGLAADVGAAPGGFPVKNGISNSIGNMTDAAFAIYDTTQSGDASLSTSSYLGATFRTVAQTATFDAAENLLFGGYTDATAMPVVNPYQAACAGGCYNSGNYYTDGFISRIQFLPPTPRLVFTPASYSLGSVAVGDSPSVTITLTNKGTGPANSFTYSATTVNTGPPAPDGSFTETSNCPDTLAPGASCTFTVVFKPGPGEQTTLTLTAYTGATQAATATLSGTGVAPAATLQPSSLSFGNVTLGSTSSVQIAELTNTGSTQFQVSSIIASDPAIVVHTSYCATPVTSGNYCKLEVTFAPSAAGAFSGSVVINYYLGNGTSASQNFSSTLSITGTGVVPSVTLTPASADFGSVNDTQTSSAKTFTVTNSGAVAVTLSQVTIAGPFQITSGATCVYNTQLPAGQSCTIPVVFAPISSGTDSGTLYVSYIDGSGGAVTKTSLPTGTGLAPTLTPASLNFGTVPIGTYSAHQTLTFTNSMVGAITLGTITVQNPAQGGTFAYDNHCGSTLASGASCTVDVIFGPTVIGPVTGGVSLAYGGGSASAALAGTGGPAVPLQFTPASLNFGSVPIGTYSAHQTLTLTNTTLGAASLSAITVQNPAQGGSFAYDNHCGPTLSGGASCTIDVIFGPTVIGPVTGSISISYPTSSNGNITSTAILTGTGSPAVPLKFTPASLNFGSVPIGTYSAHQTLTLTNTTLGAASLNAITIQKPAQGGTFAYDNHCSPTLASGASCTIDIIFGPTAIGPATGSISISYPTSSNGNITRTATLTGTGGPAPPPMTFSPATVDFGTISIGSFASPQKLTYTNTTSSTLQLGAPTTQPPFSLANHCGTTLAAGASCYVAVIFGPTSVGAVSGLVSMTTTNGSVIATLAGTGITAPPTLVLSPSNYSFGYVSIGSTASKTVTLTNVGGQQASYNYAFATTPGFAPPATNCTTTLAPNASCTFTITYTGVYPDDEYESLQILGTAGTNSVAAKLTATSIAGEPSPDVIDLGNGFTAGALTLNGAAQIANGLLQVTANQASQASSAFYPTPMSTTRFSTDLAFQLLDPLAEGITFAIQGDSPNAVGTSGGGLGYQGMAKSIALKFDLRDTAGEGVDSTGIYINGAAPTVPAISLASSGIDLHSGHVFRLHIDYDGTTEGITLTDTVTNAVWTTQVAEDIPSIVGGNTAYFGFTAGTGAINSNAAAAKPAAAAATASSSTTANILYWNYVDQSPAAAAPAMLTPTALNFGNITVGSTSDVLQAYLKNTGTVPFTIASITASDPASGGRPGSGGFQGPGIGVLTSYCDRPVTPGNFCELHVTLTPGTAGAFSGNVVINYYLGDGSLPSENFSSTLQITGNGVVPSVTLTPASADFGSVNDAQTSSVTIFTLTNTGAVAVTLSQLTIAGPFQIASGATCIYGAQLLAGASCAVAVVFAPVSAGASSGTLYVSYTAGAGAVTQTSLLTGTGIAVPTATLTPSTYNFGNVTLGQIIPAVETVTLTNTGTVTLTVGAETVSGAGFNDFGLRTCGKELFAGQSCTIDAVRFSPSVAGPATGTVSVVTSAGTLTTTLTGTGIAPTATLGAIPTSNFGNVTIGRTYVQPLTIVLYNTGTVPLSVGAYSLTGAGFSEYQGAGGGNCPATLAPGRGCDLTAVEFLPTVAGPATGTVSVVTSAGTLTTTLTGTGIAPPSETPFINFGTGFTTDALMLTGPVNIAGGALQLTSGPSSAASSAFYPTPVPTQSFTTDFTFQLLDPTAEGITFTIQGDGPNAVGLGGGGLGYQGLAKSIAVKFDLKDTAGEGVDSTGIYVNGAAPTVPATSLASSGIDLHSGHIFALRLTYDGTTMSINLTDTVTNAVWTMQAAEDIPGITGGSTAYFGFTAGSGTPALSANVAAAKTAFAVRPSVVPADATTAPATSNILSWIFVANGETKTAQTISFLPLSGKTYGAAPVILDATASSGLPVSYSVTGPAKLSGSSLILTGAGTVTVTASQPGNASFAAAASVTESFAVAKAPLTVTANKLSRAVGAANPQLTYTLSGFVDGDPLSVVSGTAVLKTTAVAASPAGSYPITFSTEGLTAANYSFNYVPGTLTVTSASCQTVNYSRGFTATGLSLNGGTTIAGTALELTDGGLFEARSAFFATALPTTSFTTDFTFQITNPVADGMTFVIQANNPKVVGQSGGGLGYAGIPHSVAIKVDLHNNAGEGTDSTGTYVNGAYPSVPAIDMTPSGINLHSGHVFRVHLAYANQLTTGTITDTVTGVSASMNFPGDITEAVGDNAWFGFTGGTGANSATQKILTWSYSSGPGCPAK